MIQTTDIRATTPGVGLYGRWNFVKMFEGERVRVVRPVTIRFRSYGPRKWLASALGGQFEVASTSATDALEGMQAMLEADFLDSRSLPPERLERRAMEQYRLLCQHFEPI